MNKKLKFIICGGIMGTSWIINIYPICKKCLSQLEENPDVVKSEYSSGPKRNCFESINTTATAVTGVYEDLASQFQIKS